MKIIKSFIIFELVCLLFSPVSIFSKNYKGAELRTKDAFLYGRFEARYKPPYKDGLLASLFTYFTGNDSIPWLSSRWNEIDIEILGRYDNNIQFNTITPYQTNHVRSNLVNFNPSKDYHVYGFEWTPTYVAWFVDGEEVFRQTELHIQTLEYPQKLMMNIWNPTYINWVGAWNESVLPAFAYYDWVQYAAYTPGTGNMGTNNNFTVEWKDDFDTFDETRWEKTSHSFDGNNCDFIPENVVYDNGNMILCLTDATNLGYVDKTPPNIIYNRMNEDRIFLTFSEGIDKISAETASNYVVQGITIDSVKLLNDKKTVVLSASGIDTSLSYSLVALNIKDTAQSVNTMPAKLIALKYTPKLQFPVKINVGGPKAMGFMADQTWNGSNEYGSMDGNAANYPGVDIRNTTLDSIYQSERTQPVNYRVRVPNGNYNVWLMMAEKNVDTPGRRIFDVYAEGKQIRNDFDLMKVSSKNTAFDIIVPNVEVKDEILEVSFSAVLNYAILSGIKIDKVVTGIQTEPKKKINYNFKLNQNYPNPFNGETLISYYVKNSEEVSFRIYDILGEEIYFQKIKPQSGNNQIRWNGKNKSGDIVNSGIYLYQISTPEYSSIKKMIYLK